MSEIPRDIIQRLEYEYGINSLVMDDFGFTSQIAPTGDFNTYHGKNLAIYRLAVLLSIASGSYFNDPDLGINLMMYIFKPMTKQNVGLIKTELERKIEKYEKDFYLRDISVTSNASTKKITIKLFLKYIPSDEDIVLDFDFITSMEALMLRAK